MEFMRNGFGAQPPESAASTPSRPSVTRTKGVDDEEIQTINSCITSSKSIPLVPKSRLSKEFVKDHLQSLRESRFSKVFEKEGWYLSSRVKPHFNPLNSLDITVAWKETMRLSNHYEIKKLSQRWPYYYYLLSLILEVKLESLENFKAESLLEASAAHGKKSRPLAQIKKILEDARNVLKFELMVSQNMKDLYLEMNYRDKVQAQLQQQQANGGGGVNGNNP